MRLDRDEDVRRVHHVPRRPQRRALQQESGQHITSDEVWNIDSMLTIKMAHQAQQTVAVAAAAL